MQLYNNNSNCILTHLDIQAFFEAMVSLAMGFLTEANVGCPWPLPPKPHWLMLAVWLLARASHMNCFRALPQCLNILSSTGEALVCASQVQLVLCCTYLFKLISYAAAMLAQPLNLIYPSKMWSDTMCWDGGLCEERILVQKDSSNEFGTFSEDTSCSLCDLQTKIVMEHGHITKSFG